MLELPRGRIETIDSAGGTDVGPPEPVLREAAGIVAGESVGNRKVPEGWVRPAGIVDASGPRPAAGDPETAVAIPVETLDHPAGHAVRLVELLEAAVPVARQTAVVHAEPHLPAGIFRKNIAPVVRGQTVSFGITMKRPRRALPARQHHGGVVGADPDVATGVLEEAIDVVICETVPRRVVGVRPGVGR